jgi:hypothetical protein
MAEDTNTPSHIGWLRAVLSAAAIAIVGIVVLVYGTNAVLTKWHGRTRTSLAYLATAMFFVALLAMCWGLRQLQRRKLI